MDSFKKSTPEYQRSVAYQPSYISSGAAEVNQTLAARLGEWTQRFTQENMVRSKKEGFEAGKKAGRQVSGVELPDGSSIREQAFIEGANASNLSAVKLDIYQNLQRIQSESNGDPKVYEAKVAGYKKGLIKGANPDVMPLASQEIDFASSKVYSSMVSKKLEIARKEQSAKVELGLELIETEGQNAASEGDEEAIVKNLNEYNQLLTMSESAGLIKPGETTARMGKYTKVLRTGVYMGEFMRALDNGEAVDYVAKFSKAKDKNFTPTERQEIVSDMIKNMNQVNNLETKARKADDDERKIRYAKTENEATLLALTGDLDVDYLTTKLKDDSIDPKLARMLEKTAKSKGVQYDDESQLLEYSLDLLSFSESEIATDETLTKKTRIALIDQRRKLVENEGDWRNSQSGREAVRRIKAEYGLVDGLIAQLDPEKAKRAGRTLTSLYESVESLPLEERATKAILMADNLIKSINREDKLKELSSKQKRLSLLPYQSEQEIDDAGLGGHEASVEKKRIINLLRDIERLQDELK